MSVQTTSIHYFALAIGDQAMEDPTGKYQIGDEVHLIAGYWHGMGGEEEPAWMEYGFNPAKRFDSPEEALEYVDQLDRRGKVNVRPGSVTICRTVKRMIIEEESTVVGVYK
ncbi:hypothetical protein PHIN3_148 [Sinorhizobium phage phiN3]|uniref:Uncharacterized protein n=1 Tax=Sinorhizobium phage phiN3 TaxID=1647405 RepID=A0A0F6WCU0_9CAUD|nr:hypothetical protein AVT40_gp385 [Sinorhizobium phage phiN3]AKF13411.1 hypothetical protein PHIN3_148 [Sinorhizobium phage phiN3]